MEHRIIPCVEGDDAFIAGKLNTINDSIIGFEDAIEDELVVFKVTDSDGNIIAGCNLLSTAGGLRIWISCGWKKSTANRESAPP